MSRRRVVFPSLPASTPSADTAAAADEAISEMVGAGVRVIAPVDRLRAAG